jgi:glyoxylase-like metal-dependent hydrolase (beta-lactamase superfamily II)
MIVKTFVVPPIDNNNYTLTDEETGETALIDCSSLDIWDKVLLDDNKIAVSDVGENRLELNNINLKYILLTHGHFDHIAGIRNDKLTNKEVKIPVLVHEADMNWIKSVNTYMPMMGMPEITIPTIDRFIEDGDVLKLGKNEIKVIYTPGHTQGGVCYYTDGKLFSGDTIFYESVGRCDLPGGNFEQLVENIKNKIFTLPENTVIYPGHGKPTTVGWEKEHNCFS